MKVLIKMLQGRECALEVRENPTFFSLQVLPFHLRNFCSGFADRDWILIGFFTITGHT
jgi:hypothetical protein